MLFATALAGCGGDPVRTTGDAAGFGPRQVGTLQAATCRDWVRKSVGQRLEITRRLGVIVAGPQRLGNTLSDREAYNLFERACNSGPGRGLSLYEIYVRAAAFESVR